MADIEMDIDAIHQPSIEVTADDDLIHYDSDTVDYHIPADDIGAHKYSQPSAEAAQETYPESASQSGEFTVRGDAELAGDTTTSTLLDENNSFEQANGPGNPLEAEAADSNLAPLTGTDEIDYSISEVDYIGEQHDVETQDDSVGQAVENLDLSGAGEEDRVEISWEDYEPLEHEAADEKDLFQVQPPSMTAVNLPQSHEDDACQDDAVENEKNENGDYSQDELQAPDEAITDDAFTGDGSMDSTGELLTENSDSQFPSITVQYQGDEFPFLSLGTEGFFSDAAILGVSMQNVLGGFRSQLGDDIRPEDELVFQIDELGLEFTESNTCLNITMHQILELFDLLTKNDDPDSARTLYTYLSTRINSARRFEFLVESATEGKGLDEVQHIFPQESSHQNSDLGNGNDRAMSGADQVEEMHEYANDYPEEGVKENENDVEERENDRDEEENENDRGEDEEENYSKHDAGGFSIEHENSEEITQSFEEHAGEQDEIEYEETAEFHADVDYYDADGIGQETDEISHMQNPNEAESHMQDSSFASANLIEAESHIQDSSFASENLIEAEPHVQDLTFASADPMETVDAAENEDSFANEHSSTTSTLQGDADATALSADADDETAVEAETENAVFVAESHGDAEIDWRDDDEVEIAGDGGSVAGKRSRDDDDNESNMDDEIEFKRRRP